MLGKVTGQFHKVRGTLQLDREHPENSSVTATLPAATVDTGNRTRDSHLRTELFQTDKYSEINFRSRSVNQTAANRARVTGDLTMHGVTRPFVLNVTLLDSDAAPHKSARWHATGVLKRSDFGLLWSRSVEAISMIGDNIDVQIDAESVPAN